jgi:hypothetical protein
LFWSGSPAHWTRAIAASCCEPHRIGADRQAWARRPAVLAAGSFPPAQATGAPARDRRETITRTA